MREHANATPPSAPAPAEHPMYGFAGSAEPHASAALVSVICVTGLHVGSQTPAMMAARAADVRGVADRLAEARAVEELAAPSALHAPVRFVRARTSDGRFGGRERWAGGRALAADFDRARCGAAKPTHVDFHRRRRRVVLQSNDPRAALIGAARSIREWVARPLREHLRCSGRAPVRFGVDRRIVDVAVTMAPHHESDAYASQTNERPAR